MEFIIFILLSLLILLLLLVLLLIDISYFFSNLFSLLFWEKEKNSMKFFPKETMILSLSKISLAKSFASQKHGPWSLYIAI